VHALLKHCNSNWNKCETLPFKLKHHLILCMHYWNTAIQIETNVKHALPIYTIDEWSSCENLKALHVKFVKQFKIAHVLLKYSHCISEINVKPQSLTGTVEGFDGSFCETPSYFSMHYWNTALQNEKKTWNKLAEMTQ
jgi:hypothetical protein